MITKRNIILTSACVLGMGGLLQTQAMAVEADFTGASVMLSAPVCGEAHLRISNDDVATSRSFDSCAGMTFSAVDDEGQPLPDGVYQYELTMVSETEVQDQMAMQQALETDDEAAVEEIALRQLNYTTASDGGMFRVSGGAASAYDESVWEAEALAEKEAAKEAEAAMQDPIEGANPGLQ